MCGIAGFVNSPHDPEKLKAALLHRGPDEQAAATDGDVTLVHTRLSIQDIEGGHQPLHYGPLTIVFNGEIYNHAALRKELPGHHFSTRSDTETFLQLYAEFGAKALELVDGMFAFAILDRRNKTLVLGRDRMGKKPLYYLEENGGFFFASELNALKAGTELRVNEEALLRYLRLGFFFREETAYRNVKALENGTLLTVDLKTMKTEKARWFDLKERYALQDQTTPLEECVERVDAALVHGVRERLHASDLEVGAFLSGGIDSSLITAVASGFKNRIKTFTVSFPGAYDEAPLARLTAQKYGTDHTELSISMNLKDEIGTILAFYGQPFMDSSAVPSFYVSRAAREHVTVILNGDGADELFGGYRRYVPYANGWVSKAQKLAWLTRFLPLPHEKKSKYNMAYRLLELAGKKGAARYLSGSTDVFEGYEKHLAKATLSGLEAFLSVPELETMSDLSRLLYLDGELILFGDLLVKMDIATMAHSLEGRSPFLGKEMIELAPTLPDKAKVDGTTTKKVLRELAKRYLSEELITQPKRGFEVPLKGWVDNDLKTNIHDLLAPGCYAETFIDRKFLDALLAKKAPVPDEKRAKMLWSLFCLESWRRNDARRLS